MITPFNSRSVYIGTDLRHFNEIRDSLDRQHIRYTYRVRNRLGQFNGRGTVRSTVGSAGQLKTSPQEYEILVHKNDFEKVRLPELKEQK